MNEQYHLELNQLRLTEESKTALITALSKHAPAPRPSPKTWRYAIAVAAVVYVVLVIVLKVITYDDCMLLPAGEKIAKILRVR